AGRTRRRRPDRRRRRVRSGLRGRPGGRTVAARLGAAGGLACRGPPVGTGPLIARVQAAGRGVYEVDLDEDEVVGLDEYAELDVLPGPAVSLPRVVATAGSGSTIV